MKKIFLASLCSMLSLGAIAADDQPQPSMGGPRGGMFMMNLLTEEQQACIKAYGCAMPEKKQMDEKPVRGEKPAKGEKMEMTAEQKESMECMQKAMESCGIEMPEGPKGEKPDFTRNK